MTDEQDNTEWLNEYPMLQQVNPADAFVVPVNYFAELEGKIMNEIKLTEFIQAHPQGGFTTPVNYFDELTQNVNSRVAIDTILNNGKGFTVPQNYFETLTADIESRIAIDEVLNNGKGFTVPANYFDQLTGNIESRIAIDELINTEKGFIVPENYFDELSNNIQSRVAIDELLNAENGFVVPESYFEDLSSNIESRIAVEDLLNQDQGFTLPVNYFEGLEARILQNTVGEQAPVKQNKPVVRKMWTTNTFKYATAACFSLFVGAAIMMSEFNNTAIHNRSDVHKALSNISNSDIESYLELNSDAPTVMENSDPNNLSSLLNDDGDSSKIN